MTEQGFPKVQYIGEKIKFLRMNEGMNLKDMATTLKLHSERIANLEIGVYRAELQDTIRYCDFFGLDYEFFLFADFMEFRTAYVADNEKMMKAIGYNV